jgi:predicted RNase H-like HicB family nuclease
MDIRATMRQEPDGSWVAEIRRESPVVTTAPTREACVDRLRDLAARHRPADSDEPLTLIIEVLPVLAGVAEAAEVMHWDKRRVVTYIDRGRFPKPLQALASGRIWLRSEVEAFAAEWRERRDARRQGRGGS